MTTSSTSDTPIITPGTPNVNTTSTSPEKTEPEIHADTKIPGGTDYYAPSSKATRSKGVAFGDALSSKPQVEEGEGGEKKLKRKTSNLTNPVDTVQQNEKTAIEEKTKSFKRRMSGKLTTFFGNKAKAVATTDEPKETKEPEKRTLKRAISGRGPSSNVGRAATTISLEKTEQTEGGKLGEKAEERREKAARMQTPEQDASAGGLVKPSLARATSARRMPAINLGRTTATPPLEKPKKN